MCRISDTYPAGKVGQISGIRREEKVFPAHFLYIHIYVLNMYYTPCVDIFLLQCILLSGY